MATHLPSQQTGGDFENFDRISNLPKEVINQILERLPIRDAVKTSILSTAWRYKWTCMSELVFDTNSIRHSVQPQRVNFVNKLLFLHNSTISKFEINHFLEYGCSDVDHWILVLSRKPLNHLVLAFMGSSHYQVPACLFSCQRLKILKLEGCILKLPSHYNGFSCLLDLTLYRVPTLTNEAFESLVVKIPLLQSLRIWYCESLTHFNIHAPNLEIVGIAGPCDSINFGTTENVKKAVFRVWLPGTSVRYRLDKVLGELSAVHTITFHHPFVEFLPMDVAPERLETTFYKLTCVNLDVNFDDSEQILAVLCLCKSAPYMKTLNIKAVESKFSEYSYKESFWNAQLRREDDIFHHLEIVSLARFKGIEHDVSLTQFILMNAMVLETFCISWEENTVNDERLHVVEKMMQFQRASSKAKVVFNGKA